MVLAYGGVIQKTPMVIMPDKTLVRYSMRSTDGQTVNVTEKFKWQNTGRKAHVFVPTDTRGVFWVKCLVTTGCFSTNVWRKGYWVKNWCECCHQNVEQQ